MSPEIQTVSKNLDSCYRFAADPDWAYLLTVEEVLEKQSHNKAVIGGRPICRFAISPTVYLENDENTYYHHQIVEKYLTRRSLASLGEVSLDFSINHQQVIIHRLNVVRQGQVSDKLKTSHYFLNDTVRSNAEQLHGGNGQLNIVINELQVGDVLGFSYTIAGASPSMMSCFDYGMELRTCYPLLYRRLAIIKLTNKAIFWKKFAGEVATVTRGVENLPEYDCICFEVSPEQIEIKHKEQEVPLFD